MKQIVCFVILAALLAISVFYIRYLRSENNLLESENTMLENSVEVQIVQLEYIIKRAEKSEQIAQNREQEIQALNQKQGEFNDELEKEKDNKDFKIWFDAPLPHGVGILFKEDTGD